MEVYEKEKNMEQEARRRELYSLPGDLPKRDRAISAAKIDEREHDGYILEKLTLDLNGIEPVPAYFARPKKISGKAPTVLYNHAHGVKINDECFIHP
ncbi:MAG: hypothetical protein ACE5PV_15525 [Candidatus Poribacteria bacterium]